MLARAVFRRSDGEKLSFSTHEILRDKKRDSIIALKQVQIEVVVMNKAYEKQIGEKIKLLREERKLTQEEAAARLQVLGCDVTRSALAKIEVGQRHIYPDEIKRLAEIFKVSCDDILM